jgi:hypothetical protein
MRDIVHSFIYLLILAKRPSEVLTKRRESNLDETRRKSNASAGKSKATPKDKFDTDI